MFRAFFIPAVRPRRVGRLIRRWQRLFRAWTDLVAYRHGMPNHVIPFGRGSILSQPLFSFRARDDMDASAILLLGAICNGVLLLLAFPPLRLPVHAAHGQSGPYQLFPPTGWRLVVILPMSVRWEPSSVATSLLVPGHPEVYVFDSSSDGHCL